MSGKCRKEVYTSNDVVYVSRPLICFGGFRQPECEHLEACLNENGFGFHITKSGRRRIRKLKAQVKP